MHVRKFNKLRKAAQKFFKLQREYLKLWAEENGRELPEYIMIRVDL